MTSWTRCWLAALSVGCSPLVVRCTESFDFDFFSAIFISWMIKDIRKCSLQKVRDKGGLWTGRFWPNPINSPHILKTTSTGEDLHITRLTCDSGVNFRNQYDCWPQWPIQRIQLWSQFLLIWIRTSWKFIHYRMSVSNRWVLSLKIQLLLSIRISQTSTRLSSHFYTAFRLFKHRKMNNFKCV